MPKLIALPDGTQGEFPDDMPDAAIESVLQRQFPPPAQAPVTLGDAGATLHQDLEDDTPNSIMAGIAKSAMRSYRGVGTLLPQASQKWLERNAGMPTERDLAILEAGTRGNTASTVGALGTDVATFALPGAAGGRAAATLLPKAAAAAPRVTALTGQFAGNTVAGAALTPEDRAKSAALGAAGTVAVPAAAAAGRAAAHGASELLGFTTGAGGESVRQAFKGAPGFVENMRGTVLPGKVVEDAKAGILTMRQAMHQEYQAALPTWTQGAKIPNLQPVQAAHQKLVADLTVQGFSKLAPAERATLKAVGKTIDDFAKNTNAHNVVGFDALKQRLQSMTPDHTQPQARRVVTNLVGTIRGEINKAAPAYAKAMENYAVKSAELTEIEKALSLGDRATTDTALRKLQSLARNNANANYGQRLRLAGTIAEKGGQDVMPAIAGQALNSPLPRGLNSQVLGGIYGMANMGNPAGLAGLAAASPRMVGEGAYLAGRVANPLIDALRKSPNAVAALPPAALLSILRGEQSE